MRMKALITAVSVALATPALAQTIVDGSGADMPEPMRRAMMEKVTHDLKDPMSAQFRGIRPGKPAKGNAVSWCGEVNAKNSYGAYVGFKKFWFASNPGGVNTAGVLDPSQLFNDIEKQLYAAHGCAG